MATEFNPSEIFAMALAIERQGVDFYTRAAGLFEDVRIKSLLMNLAGMETVHLRRFEEMLAELGAAGEDYAGFDPDGLAANYLQALTEGRIFPAPRAHPALPLRGDEGLVEIFQTALAAEKDSIVFYTGLKELVGRPAARETLTEIIHEEMGHIVLLNRELASLGA